MITNRNHGADWVKWLAISTMVVDHLKWIDITSLWAPLFELIGRLAFPLFALLIGWNFHFHSKNPELLCKRVLLAGVLMWAIELILLANIMPLAKANTFFTLGLGCLLALCIEKSIENPLLKQTPESILPFLFVLGTCYIFHEKVQYGLPGIGLTTLCCLFPPNKLWKVGVYIPLAFFCNYNPIYSTMSALAIPLGAILLNYKKVKPCPLPNTKLLYLSMPLSYLPAWIAHLIK